VSVPAIQQAIDASPTAVRTAVVHDDDDRTLSITV
jgi:hypothetical protein